MLTESSKKNLSVFKKYLTDIYEYVPIYIIFFILLTIKIFLIHYIKTPSIIGDELIYISIASSISDNFFYVFHANFPVIYSLLLSFGDISTNSAGDNFPNFLIINAFITSVIIFPAFFLLKGYCEKNIALTGALIIGIIPSVFNWTFHLMSECLITTLFVFSIYFLERTVSKNAFIWPILFILSVTMATNTKALGIFIIISSIFTFTMIIGIKYRRNELYNFHPSLFAMSGLIAFLGFLIFQKLIFGNISSIQYYNTGGYASYALSLLTTTTGIIDLSVYFMRELGVICILTYFIITVVAIVFYITLILKFTSKKIGNKWLKSNGSLSLNQEYGLVGTGTYALTTIIGFAALTSVHMLYVPTWQYPGQASTFLVFSRYLDPYITGLFLLAIIGYSKIDFSNQFQTAIKAITGFFILIGFGYFFGFIYTGYRFGDTLSFYYINYCSTLFGQTFGWLFIMVIFTIAAVSFLISIKRNNPAIFLLNIMLISSILCSGIFIGQIYSSDYSDSIRGGEAARYLMKSGALNENSKVYIFHFQNSFDTVVADEIIRFWLEEEVPFLYFNENNTSFEELLSENCQTNTYLILDFPLEHPDFFQFAKKGDYYIYKTFN